MKSLHALRIYSFVSSLIKISSSISETDLGLPVFSSQDVSYVLKILLNT
jgi:hypothetical protein